MLINWLANRIATQLQRSDRKELDGVIADLRKEREDARREVRTLISEMEDMLEKFSRVVARQAMRRIRDAKRAAAAADPGEEPEREETETTHEPVVSKEAHKAALRRRLMGSTGPLRRNHG